MQCFILLVASHSRSAMQRRCECNVLLLHSQPPLPITLPLGSQSLVILLHKLKFGLKLLASTGLATHCVYARDARGVESPHMQRCQQCTAMAQAQEPEEFSRTDITLGAAQLGGQHGSLSVAAPPA